MSYRAGPDMTISTTNTHNHQQNQQTMHHRQPPQHGRPVPRMPRMSETYNSSASGLGIRRPSAAPLARPFRHPKILNKDDEAFWHGMIQGALRLGRIGGSMARGGGGGDQLVPPIKREMDGANNLVFLATKTGSNNQNSK